MCAAVEKRLGSTGLNYEGGRKGDFGEFIECTCIGYLYDRCRETFEPSRSLTSYAMPQFINFNITLDKRAQEILKDIDSNFMLVHNIR